MVEWPQAPDWQVGHRSEPYEFLVTPELNQQYLFGQEDFDAVYVDGAGVAGTGLVHPALVLNMSNGTRSSSSRQGEHTRGLAAMTDAQFRSAVEVGSTIRVEWSVVDRYEKRGRPYVVREATVRDGSGAVILERRTHSTVTRGEGAGG